jgi:hypothetical protein
MNNLNLNFIEIKKLSYAGNLLKNRTKENILSRTNELKFRLTIQYISSHDTVNRVFQSIGVKPLHLQNGCADDYGA